MPNAQLKELISMVVQRAATGWCVVILLPKDQRVELHDFQTEAGAKAWIRNHGQKWIEGYYDLESKIVRSAR